MRILISLMMLFSTQVHAGPFLILDDVDIHDTAGTAARSKFFADVEAARAEYLASGQISAEALAAAQETFVRISRLDEDYKVYPPLDLPQISNSVLPFWRDMMAIARSTYPYISYDPEVLYRMIPAPWGADVWQELRVQLQTAMADTRPMHVSGVDSVLRNLAARPNPEINRLPKDISRMLFAWIEKLPLTSVRAPAKALSLAELINAIEDNPHSENRRYVALALEAYKPGSLFADHPDVATVAFKRHDIGRYWIIRAAVDCESALKP